MAQPDFSFRWATTPLRSLFLFHTFCTSSFIFPLPPYRPINLPFPGVLPLKSSYKVWGSVVSSPSGSRARPPNSFWCIWGNSCTCSHSCIELPLILRDAMTDRTVVLYVCFSPFHNAKICDKRSHAALTTMSSNPLIDGLRRWRPTADGVAWPTSGSLPRPVCAGCGRWPGWSGGCR